MNMQQMMRQMHGLQEQLKQVQADLASREYVGDAGGQMVSVTLLGNGDVKSLRIDPSLMKESEVEILEDLIVAAMKNAKQKLQSDSESTMSKIVPLSAKLPFNF